MQFIAKWINRTRFCSAENLIKPSEKNRISVLSSLTDPSSYLPVCSGSRTVRHAPFACWQFIKKSLILFFLFVY
ncbi:MAG TPA: hypothetical protein DCY03_30385 [Planctomycetaceae bacterium]|nr:hypothetical protein [Planctomycetaceae bacterium]